MPIFISHTTRDDELAQEVCLQLTVIYNIDCYIDDVDKDLENNRGKSSLTPLLIDRLRKCDMLLAVVTENTQGSWWVPFEIGTAREMPRIISTYTTLIDLPYSQEALPEYLLEWPRLRSNHDIEVFAKEYKEFVERKRLEEETGFEHFSQSSISPSGVRNFESTVMKSLGQRSYR